MKPCEGLWTEYGVQNLRFSILYLIHHLTLRQGV